MDPITGAPALLPKNSVEALAAGVHMLWAIPKAFFPGVQSYLDFWFPLTQGHVPKKIVRRSGKDRRRS